MLAGEHLIQAEGWKQFDAAKPEEENQDRLEFSHKVTKLFNSRDGKVVLKAMIEKYMVSSFTNDNDPYSIIRKQGRADVIKDILTQIEISNNTK